MIQATESQPITIINIRLKFSFLVKRKLRNADPLTYFRQENCSPHFENEKSKLAQ